MTPAAEIAAARALIAPLRAAMADFAEGPVRAALAEALAPEATVRLAHPLGEPLGAEGFWRAGLAGLAAAMPDLERRDLIVIAGETAEGALWVGCCGHYVGTLLRPWLDIPPTGHLAAMRFHEFFRVEEGRVREVQALWDIPALMMQAGAWPMGPGLGREVLAPGPMTQDGLGPHDPARSAASRALVLDMLAAMVRHPAEGGPEVMELERFWHPRFNWYGPAGIGTARGVSGFRRWHQVPFLAAMPDRGRDRTGTEAHFFAEGDYVAVTGWPDMAQTLTGDGWLGIAPTGARVTLRSLDFWRVERGLIRENWVLVDLLDLWAQIGVDVLGRMRAFNKARAGFDPETGRALP